MKKRLVMYCVCGMLAIITAYVFFNSSGIRAASDVKPYVDMLEQSHKGMTLWQLIKTGGVIMVFLGLLSMAAIACIIYNFRHLMVNKLLPQDFAESVIDKLNKRRFQLVEEICMSNDNLIAGFVQSGLQKADKGTLSVREAMERRARKDIASIWQNISYLSDIAMISPMIGLLGTVVGMIQAFNVIAFQTAGVKPILLAGGISKAMVTTAGGLIVAIPAMLFYAYFRGRAQIITHDLESYLSDIVKVVDEAICPEKNKLNAYKKSIKE